MIYQREMLMYRRDTMNTATLYQHKSSKDTAIEVLKSYHPAGKNYFLLKVRWWRTHPKGEYCMGIVSNLTWASDSATMRDRKKIDVETFYDEWKPYTPHSERRHET